MSQSVWYLEDVAGVLLARCRALELIPGIAHAFSTRRAFDGAGFDLGPAEGGGEAFAWRRRVFLAAAGLGHGTPLLLRQVHGRAVVDAATPAVRPPEADGSFRVQARGPEAPFPAVRTADCVPLLIADPQSGICAAVHAGWRGTAAGIAAVALDALRSSGCRPDGLVFALGPAIRGCCYEVGPDVVGALERTCPDPSWRTMTERGKARVDLHAALRSQLVRAGAAASAIHGAPWCTRCRNDLFFSVRAEGQTTGRLMAVIGPGPSP